MKITLQKLIPIPLKDRILKTQKNVWNNELVFDQTNSTKIIAPSGTGKTTLMNMLYGLRNDYEGHIYYDDVNIKNISLNEMANIRQEKLSVVFQDLRLFPQLSATENIEIKRTMQKPFYEKQKIEEMAETLSITHILKQQVAKCSYGEQQRIAIIRALMQPFTLLLMDEPFSHLDSGNTKKAAELITKECKERNAGFVVTDLDEDENFAYTRILML